MDSTIGSMTIGSLKKDEFGRYKTIIRTYKPNYDKMKVWELAYDRMTRLIKDSGNTLFYRSQNTLNRNGAFQRPESRNIYNCYDPLMRRKLNVNQSQRISHKRENSLNEHSLSYINSYGKTINDTYKQDNKIKDLWKKIFKNTETDSMDFKNTDYL